MGRKDRLQERIVNAAGALPSDEHVEVVGVAQTGSPKGDLAASAIASVASAAAGAGPSLLGDKRYGLILTNTRLLFVEIDKDFGKVKDGIAREWPRAAVTASSMRAGWLMTRFDLQDTAGSPLLTLNFPRAGRAEGEAINQALRRA